MARIGVYVEKYNISRSEEMEALTRFSYVARRLGHQADFLFRADTSKIPQYDAIYIRALTDPLNSAYVAARTAELNGIRVIDQPDSIYICCDKVNMYRHLQNAGVPLPETIYLEESDLTLDKGDELLQHLGSPVVLKAPNSSFSMYVEKIHTPEDFVKVGNRFMRRADRLVAQKFVVSDFDWRICILAGEPLFACQYTFPKKRWKVLTYVENGKAVYGPIKGIELETVPPRLIEIALQAGNAIGNGLYGVDLKQEGDQYVVIEVNDNPTISAGEEDQKAPMVYERIIRYLVGEWGMN